METINRPTVEQDTVADRHEIVLPAGRESAPNVESRGGVITIEGRVVEAHDRGSIYTGESRPEMPAASRAVLSGVALRDVEATYTGHAVSSHPAQPVDM